MVQKKKPRAEKTAKAEPQKGKAKRTKPAAKPKEKKALEEMKPEQPTVVQEIQPEETEAPDTVTQEPEKDYTLQDLLDAITVDSEDDGEEEILNVEDILGDDADVDDENDDEDFPFPPELQAKLDKADEVFEAGRRKSARLLERLKMEREETEAYVNELLNGED